MTEYLRAEWYDFDDGDQSAFLHTFHSDYLPRLTALPGIRWAGHYRIERKPAVVSAIPQKEGTPQRRETTDPSVTPAGQFVLLTSASELDLLMTRASTLSDLEQASADLLSRRRNYRDAVFIEEQSIAGPASALHPASEPPPAMQLGNFNVASPEDERELGNYYRMHRFPQVAATIGCIRARKLVSTIGWPKHGILYEFQSMNPGDALFETRFNSAIPRKTWQGRHILSYVLHAPNAPHAGRRIWPEL